ncbi:hypothetical protein OV079_05660 [Nannocystis pusilla]|uniref:Uncharacterized protein n=1 Tax=Nannocystis pusilla TaxID=889268 RepID=A0A9X3EKV6_9BACT|nr:hypothetical protein [Nannocystis pusilla]MCY1005064.1 hypothetical protein [Nannocystis pusilla]
MNGDTAMPSRAACTAGAAMTGIGRRASSRWTANMPATRPGVAAQPTPMWNACCAVPQSVITSRALASACGRRTRGVCTKAS